MKKKWVKKALVVGIIVLCVGTSFIPGIIGTIKFRLVESGFNYKETESIGISSFSNGMQSFSTDSNNITSNGKKRCSIGYIDGQILFAPMDSTTTYLIDNTGVVNHTWSSSYLPGVAVCWLGNGTILRTIRVGIGPGTGGAGGGVQKVDWNGTVLWDFRYNTNGHLSHHDVKMLPNGNVLLIAWETKTPTEAIAAGRNPNNVSSDGLYPDHIIEVQPTGKTSGTIVWEWHVWDHLIQDYDSSKANYGVVKNHPELVDINYQTSSSDSDWMHTNSICYNEEFDQILVSVCYFNEIWVIDHSTTTAEAASHTGGNSGKGGDLLYRWGNPAVYQAGTTSDQKLFHQHDATWIDKGCPGEGDILVFNNGVGRGDRYSSVDEIVPPVNEKGEYYLESDSAYGPVAQTWIYTADPPTSLFSQMTSSAQRLTNGNTLICGGESGEFFEVTPTGITVWSYTNPYPLPGANNVFKIVYIPKEKSQNQPPNTPCNPAPANYATGVSVNMKLSWVGGDPNDDNIVTYDLYFGRSGNPPLLVRNQSLTSFNPTTMVYSTTYYWKIVAWNNRGLSAGGPIWRFTTSTEPINHLPNIPSNPSPPNQATGIDIDVDLSWIGGDPDAGDTVRYDVYFDTGSSPPLMKSGHTSISFDPGTMKYNTTYYWKIVANDNHNTSATSPVWDFTTVGGGENHPPNTPTITGEKSGTIQTLYGYTIQTTDPDQDNVKYFIDWGDNNSTGWFGPYTSGETASASHSWNSKGTYVIKLKARDVHYAESDWATLTVSMPCNTGANTPCIQFLQHLIQSHPRLFPILQKIFQR